MLTGLQRSEKVLKKTDAPIYSDDIRHAPCEEAHQLRDTMLHVEFEGHVIELRTRCLSYKLFIDGHLIQRAGAPRVGYYGELPDGRLVEVHKVPSGWGYYIVIVDKHIIYRGR